MSTGGDSIGRAAGSGVPIEWEGGEILVLEPLTPRIFGELEQYILSQDKSPTDVLLKILKRADDEGRTIPPEVQEKMWAKAMDDESKMRSFVDPDEVVAFSSTPKGMTMALHLCFERRYGSRFDFKTVEDYVNRLDNEQRDELFNRLLQASGLDARGNGTGPLPEETERAKHRKEVREARATRRKARRRSTNGG